jgi:hypothetical protein
MYNKQGVSMSNTTLALHIIMLTIVLLVIHSAVNLTTELQKLSENNSETPQNTIYNKLYSEESTSFLLGFTAGTFIWIILIRLMG